MGGVEARERSAPRFCTREVEAFLRCGVLAADLLVLLVHALARLPSRAGPPRATVVPA